MAAFATAVAVVTLGKVTAGTRRQRQPRICKSFCVPAHLLRSAARSAARVASASAAAIFAPLALVAPVTSGRRAATRRPIRIVVAEYDYEPQTSGVIQEWRHGPLHHGTAMKVRILLRDVFTEAATHTGSWHD